MTETTPNLLIPKPDGSDFVKRSGTLSSVWAMMDAIDANAISISQLINHKISSTDHTNFTNLILNNSATVTGIDPIFNFTNTRSTNSTPAASAFVSSISTSVANVNKLGFGARNFNDIANSPVTFSIWAYNDNLTFKSRIADFSESVIALYTLVDLSTRAALKLPQSAAFAPTTSSQFGLDLTSTLLKYFDGSSARTLVDLSLPQTLSSKTYANPVVSGTIALAGLTYTFPATQPSNTFLFNNGSGTLAWTSVPAGIAVIGTANQVLVNGGLASVNSGTATFSLPTNPLLSDARITGQLYIGNAVQTLPAVAGLAGTWRYFKAWGGTLVINGPANQMIGPGGTGVVSTYSSPYGESTGWYCDGSNWWCI